MNRCTLLILFLYVQTLSAQSVLRLQHLNVEDGLSQSSVYAIMQDRHGYMWFATGDGLNRYDGKVFLPYKSSFNDTSYASIKDRTINSGLFEDRNNKIWLTSDAGLCYLDYRHRKSRTANNSYGEAIFGVPVGFSNDSLWAAEQHNAIFGINTHTARYKYYPLTEKIQTNMSQVCPIMGGALTRQGVWVLDKAGLLFYDKFNETDDRVFASDKLYSVNLLSSGKLLLGSVDGYYLFDTCSHKAEFVAIRNETTNFPLQWKAFAENTITHTIYLGSANSSTICKINTKTGKQEFISFQNSNVNCLYIDRSQNLWVGTEGSGVFKLDIKQPKFFSYTPNTSDVLGEADGFMVKSIYKTDSGKTWLGTYDKGLIVCDLATHEQRNIPLPLPVGGQLVSTILKDARGSMVISISNKILWLDPVTGKLLGQATLPVIGSLSLQEPIIYSLVEWKKGHYLAGTNVGVFAIRNEDGAITVFPQIAMKNVASLCTWIYNLHMGAEGILYAGNRSGYEKVKITSDTSAVLLDNGFPGVSIRHFYKSKTTPFLWIASEKGLIAYNEATKQTKIFDEGEGLGNSFVYAILAQNDSTLWISTNHGLYNVKVRYGHDSDITAQFINYTSKDGLQSNEFNTGSFFQSKDGTLFFGGIAGINWFNPTQIQPNPYKAVPAITEISINDRLFSTDTSMFVQELKLAYNMNTVSFTLRALEFTQADQNQYAYKLEGLDKDWVYTTDGKVRYSNLPPGNYTFLLKASNNEGIWNEEMLKMRISIQPPYSETWWFRLLVIVAVVALVLVAIRIYVRQKVKMKTRELEKQQALYRERLRISKDVHDDLGSGLSKISLMAAIAQKKASGNAPLGSDIQQISTVSKELVDNMHDLIWVLNPENTTLEQLVARLREYCADYMEHIPMEVSIDFPEMVPDMRISRDAQRNIFLTTKEAINNCIKHADASKISISLNLDHNTMNIAVRDNGQGFDPGQLKKAGNGGNGLRNMRQRIEAIGGSFEITSQQNDTCVAISVPFDCLATEKIPL